VQESNNKKDKTLFKQARQYTCAYVKIWKDLDKQQHDMMGAEVDTTTHEADPISVEKLVKKFKTHHCCALDFDTTFCFLQGNLCQLSNIANNRAMKQTRSKQQNQLHERRQQVDVTCLLRGNERRAI
jgi:hypothetical protein